MPEATAANPLCAVCGKPKDAPLREGVHPDHAFVPYRIYTDSDERLAELKVDIPECPCGRAPIYGEGLCGACQIDRGNATHNCEATVRWRHYGGRERGEPEPTPACEDEVDPLIHAIRCVGSAIDRLTAVIDDRDTETDGGTL